MSILLPSKGKFELCVKNHINADTSHPISRDGEIAVNSSSIAVNSTVNSKAFDSTNPIYIFAKFCYSSPVAVNSSYVDVNSINYHLLLTVLLTALLLPSLPIRDRNMKTLYDMYLYDRNMVTSTNFK